MSNSLNQKTGKEGGYALVTALIFFIIGATASIAGISNAVLREVKVVRNESSSKQSYYASESALEDAVYRVKTNKKLDSVESLSTGSSTASTTVSANADGSKNVVSSGDANGTIRIMESSLDVSSGTSFPYALQGGVGGIDLDGGATITGDIYTTGSIRGCSSCTISGMAVSAGKSTSNLDQDNSSPSTPPNSITFANSTANQDLAQSFTVSQDLSLVDLNLYIKKVGSPSNATVKITTNNAGNPSTTVLASGTLSSSLVSTAYSWLDISLTANPVLAAGATYWIVIDANNNSSNYYVVAANAGVYTGQAKIGRYGSTWNTVSPSNADAYFQVSIGSNEEGISGESQYNRLPVTSSYSYKASYVAASGALYCQVGVQNNKACDTSRADPAIQSDPISDSLINSLKSEASASVSNSDISVGWAGSTIGPKKINGNLSVSGGGTLRVSGTIWVTGNVSIDGGALVMPANSTKSYVIIASGQISLSGGASITGSAGNHIVLISLSTADPAISINGGANDTVVFVPDGGLSVSGGAHVKAAAAKHISADGGANITYDPDVSQLNLDSGSTGGTFGIKSWKERQ